MKRALFIAAAASAGAAFVLLIPFLDYAGITASYVLVLLANHFRRRRQVKANGNG